MIIMNDWYFLVTILIAGFTGYIMGIYWFKKHHVHEITNHQNQQMLNPK